MWELKNILLKNSWVKEEIKTPVIVYLETKNATNTARKTHNMQPKIYFGGKLLDLKFCY